MRLLTIPEFCAERELEVTTVRRRMKVIDGVIIPADIRKGVNYYIESDLDAISEFIKREKKRFNAQEFLRQYSVDGVAYAAARACGTTAEAVRKYAATHPEFKAEMEQLKEQVERRNREKAAMTKGGQIQPDGAQFLTEGTLYKFGIHGKVFYWSGFDWVLSTRAKHEIMRGRRLKA